MDRVKMNLQVQGKMTAEDWTPQTARDLPVSEDVKVDNDAKESQGLPRMVPVQFRNLGVGQGEGVGCFPQSSREEVRRTLQSFCNVQLESAVIIHTGNVHPPSMLGEKENMVLSSTWNVRASLEEGVAKLLRNEGRTVWKEGTGWQFELGSERVANHLRRVFGGNACVEVEVDLDGPGVLNVSAGEGKGELGAFSALLNKVMPATQVNEMVRRCLAAEGLKVNMVISGPTASADEMMRLEYSLGSPEEAGESSGRGALLVGAVPKMKFDNQKRFNAKQHSVGSKYRLVLEKDQKASHVAHATPSIILGLTINEVEVSFPLYVAASGATAVRQPVKPTTEAQGLMVLKDRARTTSMVEIDLSREPEVMEEIVKEIAEKGLGREFGPGSPEWQMALRVEMNRIIQGFAIATPEKGILQEYGVPTIVASGFGKEVNGRPNGRLELIMGNVGQGKLLAGWMLVISGAVPALDPCVRSGPQATAFARCEGFQSEL
jgi:hypothetical protein